MEALAGMPVGVMVAISLALGLVIGSFLNVVVHRVPRGESIVRPGSHCPRCDNPLAPWDNVPVLSYLWLRGRCRHCGVHIPLKSASRIVGCRPFVLHTLMHSPHLIHLA